MPSVEEQAESILAALPQHFRDEAESVRAMAERERWLSGMQALELVDELFPLYAKAAIRLALAQLYHCTAGTIRDREWVCRHVSPDLRGAYPQLTYHYWRACAQSQQPRRLAAEILAYLEAWGRLPSVDAVYSWLSDNGDCIRPAWVVRLESLLATIEKIKNDPLLPVEARADLTQAESILLRLSGSVPGPRIELTARSALPVLQLPSPGAY